MAVQRLFLSEEFDQINSLLCIVLIVLIRIYRGQHLKGKQNKIPKKKMMETKIVANILHFTSRENLAFGK
jgi:hypothetical protein